ncbi:MAG: helix-turn-helix transcriptional regulator [Candidatus Omnitrophota bacterium]|jgi:DNA-binding XRE family transcriptional regulator
MKVKPEFLVMERTIIEILLDIAARSGYHPTKQGQAANLNKLAKDIGVRQSTLQRMAKNDTGTNYITLIKLMKKLGLPLEELYGDDTNLEILKKLPMLTPDQKENILALIKSFLKSK